MKKVVVLMILFFCAEYPVQASVFCPHDKNMLCSDDKYNLDKLGRPVLMGNSLGKTARYIDDNQLNSCGVGYIYRKWYADSNNDQQWQPTELFCIQTLHFSYENHPFSIQFPPDRTYSCKDNIVFEKPTWVTGPCNVMGYTYKDDVFEVANDACYKILRRFKVIDWCDSDGDGQMNTWEHTQVIKVIDEDAPKLRDCTNQEFPVGQDCMAEVILTNFAEDDQACGTQKLKWTVRVDLWANGDYDLEFSELKTGAFYLAPLNNGQTVTVRLPEKVGIGTHKVHWSVADECGNIRACHAIFTVADKKPPTPYLYTLLTAAFDATSMPLMVPARIFNVGSFDNCTPKDKLRFSFSEDVNDTISVVDCTNAGFQFFTLFITDKAGNQESVDVFLLAFDNGSCQASSTLLAAVTEGNGLPVSASRVMAKRENTELEAQVAGPGQFVFNNLPLYADFSIKPDISEVSVPEGRINLADLIWLQEYLLGQRVLTQYEIVAADVDLDHKIRARDLSELRKKILRGENNWSHGKSYRLLFEPGTISKENLAGLTESGAVMKYDGMFDFRSVLLGDLTEANSVDTENRLTSEWEIRESESGTGIFTTEDIELKGIQWAVKVHNPELRPESEILNMQPQNLFHDGLGGYRFVQTEVISIKAGTPIFVFPGAKPEDILIGDCSWVTKNDDFEKITVRGENQKYPSELLFPNPFSGDIFRYQGNGEVLFITTLNGTRIPFRQSGGEVQIENNLPAGLYQVCLKDRNGHISVKKLIKLP